MHMSGYTKLFASILGSTVWREDAETRLVWITLLALANKDGIAEASVPGLADFARVTVDGARRALVKLSSPDPDSRTADYEGRRIQEVPGGWLLLNHRRYRDRMNADERREYKRQRQAEYRKRHRPVDTVDNRGQMLNNVDSVDTLRSRSRSSTDTPYPLLGGDSPVNSPSTAEQPTAEQPPLRALPRDARMTVEELVGPSGGVALDPTDQRVQALADHWPVWYAEARHGARYRVRPHEDYAAFKALVETYSDAELERMARFFLRATDLPSWALTRSPKCFLRLASETHAMVLQEGA